MRILLIVIKTTEKRKPKIYEGKQMRERLVNKLTFYIDKLHLQEVCCRSCFHPRVYTTCFLQSTFNSLVSIPDTRVLGEALLSSPTPTTTTKKNKNNPLLFPIQQSALEIPPSCCGGNTREPETVCVLPCFGGCSCIWVWHLQNQRYQFYSIS